MTKKVGSRSVRPRSKGQRVAERQILGRLRDLLVSPRTLDRYKLAVRTYLRFLGESRHRLPTSMDALDRSLEVYIESLWELGESKSLASDLLSGLGHFLPAVRRHMSGAWRLHGAWGRAELAARAPPLTPLFTYALFAGCFHQGMAGQSIILDPRFRYFRTPCRALQRPRSRFYSQSSIWERRVDPTTQQIGGAAGSHGNHFPR